MKVYSLILAIILMSAAHFLRVLRWELFIKVYEKPNRKRLLNGLSIGYLVNYFVPYKLGDILRGFFAGKKMKNGKALGLSTVIVDRYLDVFCVGLIFCGLAFYKRGDEEFFNASKFYIILFASLIVTTLFIFIFKSVLKKLIRAIAGIFNTRIEGSVLKFAWATIWNFKDIVLKINKLKLIFITLGMWGLYIASYELFSIFYSTVTSDTRWTDIFLMFFGESGVKASTIMLSVVNGSVEKSQVFFIIFVMAPLLILLFIALFLKKIFANASDDGEYLNLLPQLNPSERLTFLDKYFSGVNREYIDNYLKINRGISIIRDYSAGSNATTMLCVDERGTFFRKYAFDEDGKKLAEQIEWIEKNSGLLSLPQIIRSEANEFYCYYDMPYDSSYVGLFEYAHSMPLEKSKGVLFNVLDSLEKGIYVKNNKEASLDICEEYIENKVYKNLETIMNSRRLKQLTEAETIFVNGKEYKNLSSYKDFLSKENLLKVFENDSISTIHGDLTIENIVCVKENGKEDGFYLIDPNTGNILDSPNLDYAKLLQSLHGGYEFLMAVKNVNVIDNRIDFVFTKSSVYEYLYRETDKYLREHFSEETVKSIYFHEIIHWLRLMPYKISKDYRTAPAFYAGMLMVMSDIYDRFSEK